MTANFLLYLIKKNLNTKNTSIWGVLRATQLRKQAITNQIRRRKDVKVGSKFRQIERNLSIVAAGLDIVGFFELLCLENFLV
jgi:hypothetical protein